MRIIRIIAAYLAAAIVTVTLACVFYTLRVLEQQAEIGAVYTPGQQFETYVDNLVGLTVGTMPSYGFVLAIALLIGLVVAAGVKRIIKPLAPIAYPVAGAAAVYTTIWAIETFMTGGGGGAIGGARDALGLAMQCLAGAIGGFVFAIARGGSR